MSERARTTWKLLGLIALVQVARAAVFWVLLRFAPPFAETITRFQLLNGASFVVVGLAALLIARPARADLGLSLAGSTRRTRILTGVSLAIVLGLVATSALFAWQTFALNVVFGLAVPAFEEGLFRGWAFGRFEKVLPGAWGAILATTALFTVWHLGYADVFAQHPLAPAWGPLLLSKLAIGMVLGLGLGWLRRRTGRVYAPFVAHALWNIFAP
jgi:membrane protease YdiL (CAAX protease family)